MTKASINLSFAISCECNTGEILDVERKIEEASHEIVATAVEITERIFDGIAVDINPDFFSGVTCPSSGELRQRLFSIEN